MSRPARPLTLRDRLDGLLRLLGWLWAPILRDLTDPDRTRETLPLGLVLWAAGWACASTVSLCWLHYTGLLAFAWWLWAAMLELVEQKTARRQRIVNRQAATAPPRGPGGQRDDPS